MKCLRINLERQLEVAEIPVPALPSPQHVRVRMHWVSLNRLDLFSADGMAFARQPLPMIAGVEGSGVVDEVGAEVSDTRVGEAVVIFPGTICGACKSCREGRENQCLGESSIRGFDTDGVAAEYVVVHARHVLPVLAGVSLRDAACAPVTAATVEHMLCDNAKLTAGESVLIQAGGSGIGSVAITLAKHLGATVLTTVGSEAKAEKARALGADHVINYREKNFPSAVRRITSGRGVDVVFEHVGAETWEGSLRCLSKGGRLVTCGSHTGTWGKTNLLHLFNQHIRIYGSFGGNYRNVRESLRRLHEREISIPIDRELPLDRMREGMERLRDRIAFGKVLFALPVATQA